MRYLPVIALVAVACGGGSSGHNTDASVPTGDTGGDGPGSGSPAAPVTLSVTQGEHPVAGVHTYFLNPDNTVAATIDTDATGTASAMLPDGGSVTALDPFKPAQPDPSRRIELQTYLGVKPGDHLIMTRSDPASIAVTVHAPLLSGSHFYDVLTTCGTGSLAGSTAIGTLDLSGCNGIADVLISAGTAGTTDSLALYHAGVAVADGTVVDLTADTFQPQRDVTFHYSHIPSGASLSVLHAFATANGTLGRSDIVFDGRPGVIQNGEVTIALTLPDIPDVSALIDHIIEGHGNHVVTEHRPLAASYDLDLSGMLLPDWETAPHYDAAKQSITWADASGGELPNLQIGNLRVTPPTPVNAAAPSQPWQWQLVGPYTAGELKLPVLPADVATWMPATGDDIDPGFVVLKVPGGSDALRTRALDEIGVANFEHTLAADGPLLKTEN